MIKPIIKKAYDLRADDFVHAPLWACSYVFDQHESWHDEVDEASFRAWDGELPFADRGKDCYLICSAVLRVADGSEFEGFATPGRICEGKLDVSETQPVMFLPGGLTTAFWQAKPPHYGEMNKVYSLLEKRPSDVFPIYYNIDSRCTGSMMRGEIWGWSSPGGSPNEKVIVS